MTPSRRTLRIVCGLALTALITATHFGAREGRAVAGVGPGAGGREALQEARRLQSELRSAEPGRRSALRSEVIAAFRAVRIRHARDPRIVAEAAFRAGEHLRIRGASQAARREFLHAYTAGRTTFRPRAALELAHSYRRAGLDARALDWYETAREDRVATRKQRDNADLWRGKVHRRAGRVDEAVRVWESLARSSPDVLTRLSAYEHTVHLLIEARRWSDAHTTARRCSQALRGDFETGEHARERIAERVAELVRKTSAEFRETLDPGSR